MTFRICDERGDRGFSWMVEEPMTRTSHALAADGHVWLVDPVDWPEATERACRLGAPAAVLQLLDRHNRDCAAVAERLGVPCLVTPEIVPESPFEVISVLRARRWQERALWWEAERTLVVAEAIGTNRFFRVGDDTAGVHGLLKPLPPRRRLGGLAPEHLLVGHGEGVHGPAATEALARALSRSRLQVVPWLARLPFAMRSA